MLSSEFAVSSADECRAEFGSAFESFDSRPKLVVDHDQNVLWCCDDAPQILQSPLPLRVGDGKLIIENRKARGEFVEFLRGVGRGVTRKLVRGKSNRHWIVVRAWKSKSLRDSACIVCSPSMPLRDVVESGLVRELGLTRAEARVLAKFAELNSPKQIARDLGITLNTVRSYLKAIHAKASVTSSIQLLRMVHTFCSD